MNITEKEFNKYRDLYKINLKKLFISGMMLFFCVFFVSCSGVTTPATIPDDGGMGSYDSKFISLLNELDNPLKLMTWLKDNTQPIAHDIAYTPYEFYLKKEGDCANYGAFICYVLHYHDYVAYSVYLNYYEPLAAHVITVFEHKSTDQYWGFPDLDKYGYFSNYKLQLAPTPCCSTSLDSIKDCVDDFMVRWNPYGYTLDYYNVNPWNYFDYYKGGK